MVPYGQDKSARLDFRGSDARNPATEGDPLWVNYSTRRFSSRSNGFLKVAFQGSRFEALNWLFDSFSLDEIHNVEISGQLTEYFGRFEPMR